ncbi:MAG: DNA helicase RecQ [Mariprofundaceae bacterium]
MQQAKECLQNIFGYPEFRPLQEDVIRSLIEGHDAFVLMPTGSGKSMCYQIPAIVRHGTGIIVSPLISLMKDQVDTLKGCGVKAAFFNSSLKVAQSKQVLEDLDAGRLDLLYVAPERLLSKEFLARLKTIDLALFAIDEAHCVSQWGHDFRPEYVQLGLLRKEFPKVPLLALTATADEHTRQDVLDCLKLRKAELFVSSFDRPNIRYTVSEKRNPLPQLLDFLGERPDDGGIVYCLSRKRVEEVAVNLQRHGIRAAAYHAGLPAKARAETQDNFLRNRLRVIVATIAFGMGVNKPNVRFVVHFDIPKSIENYYQETGRAGRDGLDSEALLLFGSSDISLVRKLIENIEDSEQRRIELHKLDSMVGFAEALTCRRKVLLGYFGEELNKPCGNCDICLSPPETFDASEMSRLALSCIHEVGERFGMHYIIDILRGSNTARIRDHRHKKLQAFGSGKKQSVDEWLSILRQLIHRGYIIQDICHHSVLKFTESGNALLAGNEQVTLARFHQRLRWVQKKPAIARDEGLFVHLCEFRATLAEEEDVAPHTLFSDATLSQISSIKPRSQKDLLNISGLGAHKLEQYGDELVQEICSYCGDTEKKQSPPAAGKDNVVVPEQASEGHMLTLDLLQKGLDVADIASKLGVQQASVMKQLVALVKGGHPLDVQSIVGEPFEMIMEALDEADPYASLSEVKQSLPVEVSNENFRLVLAWHEATA